MKPFCFILYVFVCQPSTFAEPPIEYPLRNSNGELIQNSGEGAVAFSPDEKNLAVANGLGIFLYDIQAEIPSVVESFLYENECPTLLDFSPNGEFLAAYSRILDENLYTYKLRLWDVQSGRNFQTFDLPPSFLYRGGNQILSLAISPDNRTILAGNRDSTAAVYDIASGTVVFHFDAHGYQRTDTLTPESGTTAVAFAPDGASFLTGGWNGIVKQWDARSGQEIRQFTGHAGSIKNLRFTQDGTLFLSNSSRRKDDLFIYQWELSGGKIIASVSGHTDIILDIHYADRDGKILSVSKDETLKLWDGQTGIEQRSIPLNLSNPFCSDSFLGKYAFFSPQGNYLYTDTSYTQPQIWAIANRDSIVSKTLDLYSISQYAISPDSRYVAAIDTNNVLFWEMREGELLQTHQITVGQSMILQFAFSPDGNYLLTVSYPDDTARIWDVSTFEVAQSIGPGDITGSAYHGVNSAEFSPDSQWIATCNSDGSIRVWDIKSKNQIQTILVNGVSPAWGAVSPDGKSILTGHANHDKVSVRLWDLASGELVRFHTQQNTSLRPFRNSAVYPWGFAGFLDDDALTVWDGYTGEEKRIAFKTPGLQNIPTFSTDGRYALGVPSYQGVKLFDVKTGEIVGSFGNAAYAVFASDALWGVTSDRGYTRLWKISISAGAPSWRNYR